MLHIAFVCRYNTTVILVLSLVLFLPSSRELQCTWGCSSFQEISHEKCKSGAEVANGATNELITTSVEATRYQVQIGGKWW